MSKKTYHSLRKYPGIESSINMRQQCIRKHNSKKFEVIQFQIFHGSDFNKPNLSIKNFKKIYYDSNYLIHLMLGLKKQTKRNFVEIKINGYIKCTKSIRLIDIKLYYMCPKKIRQTSRKYPGRKMSTDIYLYTPALYKKKTLFQKERNIIRFHLFHGSETNNVIFMNELKR